MPVSSPPNAEITALRSGAALVDRSERGRLALSGAEAREALSAVVTNEIESLAPGQGCLAACCTAKGRMLGDLRVLATEDELLIDIERCALQPIFDVIRRGLVGYDAELHKRTLETNLFSLLGPLSRAIAGAASLGPDEDDNEAAELDGQPVRLIATDHGVDVLCSAESAAAVRAALLASGAVEAGEQLAELARIESGRPRFGVDLDETVIPEEGGLNDRAVSFTKGCYVGQETIARLHYRGRPNRRLCSLKLSGEAELGDSLRTEEREVGTLTSVAISPEHGPIGLALIRREAEDGSTLKVGEGAATATLFHAPSEQ
jgi:folate-binding protein YgfZ